MIEISLAQLFAGALMIAFLGAGISVYVDRRRDHRRARTILRSTIRCRVCSRTYLRSGTSGAEDCPDCGRGNLKGRDRRLG
jgi:hypothetical protein